jgi:hypothetical protein
LTQQEKAWLEKKQMLQRAYENPFEMLFQDVNTDQNDYQGADEYNIQSPHSGGQSLLQNIAGGSTVALPDKEIVSEVIFGKIKNKITREAWTEQSKSPFSQKSNGTGTIHHFQRFNSESNLI